jgi:hypothetical protein
VALIVASNVVFDNTCKTAKEYGRKERKDNEVYKFGKFLIYTSIVVLY